MDFTTFETLISTLGIPVACMIASAIFVWKMYNQIISDKSKLYEELARAREVNSTAIETIAKCVEKLEQLGIDIAEIKRKLGD